MEVIARFKGNYPFGLPDKDTAYVQVLKENLSQPQIHAYQLKSVLLKEMSSTHLIKLIKIYREESNLMLLYEYHHLSLQSYIENLATYMPSMTSDFYRDLLKCFAANINNIIRLLIHFQIKVDLLIANLAATAEDSRNFSLKLFVQPDAQFMALRLPMKHHDQIRVKIQENRRQLVEFYEAEQRRLALQFQELIERRFGKMGEVLNKNPNFVITGSKLVFIHDNSPKRATHKGSLSVEKMQLIGQKDSGYDRIKPIKNKNQRKQLREKCNERIQEIKNNLRNLEVRKQQRHGDLAKQGKLQRKSGVSFFQEKACNEKEYTESRCSGKEITVNYSGMASSDDSNERQYKNQLNQDETEISNNHSKTADTFNRKEPKTQKYKMKIITSHDIEVQKVEDGDAISTQIDGDLAQQFLIKFRNCAGTPPLPTIESFPISQPTPDQDMDGSIAHSRKSDLGPATSRHFDLASPLSSDLKSTNQIRGQQNQGTNIQTFEQAHYSYKPTKMRNSEQFCDKYRQVRYKAEKLLKEYAVCKKH